VITGRDGELYLKMVLDSLLELCEIQKNLLNSQKKEAASLFFDNHETNTA
jgi:hypothetical protein